MNGPSEPGGHGKIYRDRFQSKRGVLAVPVSFGNEVIGILRLLMEEFRHFSHADINFATAISSRT